MNMNEHDIVIIGAGITGLTCAFQLKRKNRDVLILECNDRVGGQIKTVEAGAFTFESGPNTGVVKYPEVAELFEQLSGRCEMETALESSKRRLIWKGSSFCPLPSGLMSALRTPLFSWYDKFRILGEPWRAKGTDPNESVGSLAQRRLGKSYVDYAVDPFLSGVYAGDPYKLPARLALPRLYALEQQYGSFIRGSIAKARIPKTEREKKATKKVFSAKGGFSKLVEALADAIGHEQIVTSASDITILPDDKNGWNIRYTKGNEQIQLHANHVVTTCGAYSLPTLLPFVKPELMSDLNNLYYAPVVQIGVGMSDCGENQWKAFGGLIPSCENKTLLGILFPSACFQHRAPEQGAVFSYFIGGVRHPEYVQKSDAELTEWVNRSLSEMLKYPQGKRAEEIMIFRHEHAIPQYELTTDARLQAIDRLKEQYPTLTIAGNLKDGIGMGDRIKQAFDVSSQFT